MADRTIKPDDTNDLVLQNNDGSAKLELNEDQTIKVTTGSDAGEDFTVNTSQLVVEGDTARVGINTSDPDVTLDIHDANPAIDLYDTGTNGYCRIDANGANLTLHADKGGNAGSSTVKIGVDNSVKMTIDSSGNVEVESGNLVIGTAGKGITFQDTDATNDSSTANEAYTLDSYEFGTWTPAYEAASGSAGSGTNIKGFYTKIGNLVSISGTIEGGRGTLSGDVKITGLPFNVLTDTPVFYAGGISIGRARLFQTDMPNLKIALVNGTDEMFLYKNATNLTSDGVDSSDLNTNSNYNEIYFGGTYLTD